ncbi:DUF2157 domain-containing protein [Dyadobacter sp. NIV53]|uniref:DUF2157 domain-containing protein n=1 Tax=Dyadobacter sp. NIV53 TaxID=2861765 RepID=UPI001C86FE8C|nr:DUF2157 domain-containing protein [Dyadobacter sp. NIV53]
MTTSKVLEKLRSKEIISDQQSTVIESYLANKLFSVHTELRSILYLGILLLSTGLGIIIYENIDTIGHQAIIAFIGTVTVACFFYSYKSIEPFSWQKVSSPNQYAGFTLLLGCTTFLILEGYIQFQYKFFGSKYGFAAFIPTVIFFIHAYRFDHKGVLSMAITGLASWLGLTIAPLSIVTKNNFTDSKLIITAIVLGVSLIAASWLSDKKNLKKHFAFTYLLLGGNLAAIASTTGLFSHDFKVIYFITGITLSVFFIIYSREKASLVFLLMGIIYGYIILTYSVFKLLPEMFNGSFEIYYFLFSSIGVLLFLFNYKKILRIQK